MGYIHEELRLDPGDLKHDNIGNKDGAYTLSQIVANCTSGGIEQTNHFFGVH